MINIKKIVSILMSVLLIAGTIAVPAFADDAEDILEFAPISNFVGNTAKMEAADSLSGVALRVTGVKDGYINYGTKVWGYSEPQDWSAYKYCNLVVKNNDTSKATSVFIIMTPLLNKTEISASDLSAGYWMKKITIAGSSWTLISVPMAEIANKGAAPAVKNAVGGIVLAQTYGDFYVDSFWFSTEAPEETQLISTSIPDGYDDVNPGSASFTFTYSDDLASEDKQHGVISLKDSFGNSVEVSAQYSGNKITITPQKTLEYGTSYSMKISGVMDKKGVMASEYTYNFTTTQVSVVATTPVITSSSDTVQASVTVSNFKEEPASATLVLASYDEHGKMIKEKTAIESIELEAGETDKPITAEITGYSDEKVCAFVIDTVDERNLLSSDYESLPPQEPEDFSTASQTVATAFDSGSCDFANDVVTYDAKLNGTMKRTILMSILSGDEVTHMSLIHNDAEGNVNASYQMTNKDASGDYVIELKGRMIDGTLTGNFSYLSDSDKEVVYDTAKSLKNSDDALELLKDYCKAFQLDEATLADDTLMLMTAESLCYNKSDFDEFNDVVSFTKKAVEVCSKLNSQTWDTLADYVINNEEILIDTNISDFKELSTNKRNKVCYSISPLTFSSLSDLNKKLSDATDDYLDSLEEDKPSKKPSSGKGSGGGYSVTAPVVVVPPAEETPAPVVPVVPVTPAPGTFAFDDLTEFPWASESIGNLLAKGVISKSDDAKYRPADNITRAEFVKLVVCALYDATEAADGEFADVSKDEWCHSYIAIAAKHGLINGREDGTFGKNDNITRQEMAAVIHRAILDLNLNLPAGLSEYSFSDDAFIADYAKDAVYALYHTGIMAGMEDGSFAPSENANRAQAACVIDRIMKGADHE